ncbi:MAG: FHA domain-containing protein [Solirubrobacterales bacterium]|nr:FHA domain-containing protein [Solirubrobacterales bacterium]
MLEPASVALKFAFLAVLYLFLLWVARSSLRDLRRPIGGGVQVIPTDATGLHSAVVGLEHEPIGDLDPRLRVERASGLIGGDEYDILEGLVIGRGEVDVRIEDVFASSRHAKIAPEGNLLVLEDLGSTNGTFLNGEVIRGPQPLHPGDRITIGDNEFTYWQ